MLRRLEPTEHQIQAAIIEWANNTNMPYGENKIGDFLLAIPNGGKRSITEALRLKKEGVKKGVSDLFFAYPIINHKPYKDRYGLWIEVKSKNGKISKEQRKWALRVWRVGYVTEFVRTVDEGISAIKDYLGVV